MFLNKSKLGLSAIALLISASAFANDTVPAEVYAQTDGAVGGITYTQNKRFIFSYHPFYNPKVKVGELLKSGDVVPFPNAQMQTPYKSDGSLKNPANYLNWVLGVRADGRGNVWILDSGQAQPRITPKLIAWDVLNNKLNKIIYLPSPISVAQSQLNDLAISSKYNTLVIADEGIADGGNGKQAALIIVNTKTGKSRRVLQGHESALPDYTMPIIIDEGTDNQKQLNAFIGADGIVLDNAQQWLYFAPLNKKYVYRIKMADIANEQLTDKQLGERVEQYAQKPVNGGLSIDADDNLYLTIVGERTVGIIDAKTRTYRDYTYDKNMIWPDGVSIGPEGYMYTGAAQLPLSAQLNNGNAQNKAPYYIFRFKPLAEGVIGR
jgi:sugar lactone lactonase YvrE